MSVSSKWVNAIYTIVTGSKRRRNLLTPFGVLFFLTACSGLIFLSLYLDKIFGFPGFISYPAGLIAGLILLIPGIVLTLMCVIFFLKWGGTPLPLNPPDELIKSGPYSISRNPMMTGLMLQFFGFGVIMNSLTLTFITSPLLTLVMTAELKLIEEPELIKRFGNIYVEYMKEVPMFIPGFRRKKNSGKV
jgi:protein-S-isoprenylcysteine O-methyltransferase Ste14